MARGLRGTRNTRSEISGLTSGTSHGETPAGNRRRFDARQNVQGGVRYLKFLKETFQDDQLAIAAYNAGEKAVAKYGNVPPYPETVSYVAKVGKKYGEAKHAAEKNKAASRTVDKMQPVENSPRHIVGYFDPEGRLHIAMR